MAAKRIGVFTGSRSEYGLLLPVMRAVDAAPGLDLSVIAGGPHIEGDLPVAATAPVQRADETPGSTPRAIGQGILDLVPVLEDLALDGLVIYGDRFEAFAAMIAATQMSLAVGHIEGGDITQGGTLDDVVRHAMSKLAHLHFATNADAADRLARMGEEPWRIHDVGFPPIDLIRAGDYAAPDEVAETLGIDPDRPIVLFTLHPISTAPGGAATEIAECMTALDGLDAQIVLTHPNGDIGSDAIIAALEGFTDTHPGTVLRKSLGRRLYHGLLAICGARHGVCVGNSSSGLKETPAFQCPAIDIGPRQGGRLRGENVLQVPCKAQAIRAAIETALYDRTFRDMLHEMENLYGKGNAGPRIARILSETDLHAPALLQKQTIL